MLNLGYCEGCACVYLMMSCFSNDHKIKFNEINDHKAVMINCYIILTLSLRAGHADSCLALPGNILAINYFVNVAYKENNLYLSRLFHLFKVLERTK